MSFVLTRFPVEADGDLPWGEEEDLHEVVEEQLKAEGRTEGPEEYYEEEYFDSDEEDGDGDGATTEGLRRFFCWGWRPWFTMTNFFFLLLFSRQVLKGKDETQGSGQRRAALQ